MLLDIPVTAYMVATLTIEDWTVPCDGFCLTFAGEEQTLIVMDQQTLILHNHDSHDIRCVLVKKHYKVTELVVNNEFDRVQAAGVLRGGWITRDGAVVAQIENVERVFRMEYIAEARVAS